ncbi:MAG: hypothetical protein SFV15_14750 [Polyangiaceae bacterium]|nr:hypothetical protein [Polyangiaceae bacterium]
MTTSINRRDTLSAIGTTLLFSLAPRASYAEDGHLSADYLKRRREEMEPSLVFSESLFKRLPGIGLYWLVPPGSLLLDKVVASWTYVFGTEFGFRTATHHSSLSTPQAIQLARRFPDAVCDPTQPFYTYRTPHPVKQKTIVLGLASRPTGVTVGMYRGQVPAHIIHRDFPIDPKTHRVLAQRLTGPNCRDRFALYAAYSRASDEIRRMSIVLYSRDWRLLGRQNTEIPEDSGWCDGCAVPRFDYGLEYAFGTFNMLSLSDFPFPLLLANTSTIEGRALTLSTFDENHLFVSYPIYHQVVGCPSFEPLAQ